MMPTTPNATLIFFKFNPLGNILSNSTAPQGARSAATSRMLPASAVDLKGWRY